MSHKNHTQNKQQKHPKVHFQEYLYNSKEPMEDLYGDVPAELEAELLGDSFDLRRRFRHVAQRIRSRY